MKTIAHDEKSLAPTSLPEIPSPRASEEIARTFADDSYRLLFDESPLPMWVYDLETLAFLAVNEAAVRNYGYSREEFLSMTIKDIGPPEDLLALLTGASARKSEVASSGVWKHRRKDATLIDVEITSQTIKLGGRAVELVAAQDVTERIKAQAALEASEDRYRDLVENSRDLICTHDLDGRLLSVNPHAARVCGYSSDALAGQNIKDFLPPEYRCGFHKYLEEIKSKGVAEGLMTVITAGGERRLWEFRNTLRAEGAAGPVVRGMARDVTEEKEAEEILRRREEYFRSLIENSSDIITVIEATGVIRYESPSVGRVLGYSLEEMAGRNAFGFIHPEDVERVREVFQESFAGGTTAKPIEYRFRHRDGSWRVMESVGKTLVEGGEVLGIINSRDVTERRRAEEALRESEATLSGFYSAAPVLMGVVELRGDDILHVYDNPATCRFFRKDYGETAGRLASDLGAPAETVRTWLKHYRESERTGHPVRFEYPHPAPNGARLWLSVVVSCVSSTGAEPGGRPRFCYVAEDMTARKQAEERTAELTTRIEAERARLTNAFDLAPAFIATVRGPEHHFEMANRAYYSLVGQRNLVGRPVREALAELEGQGFFELLDRVYETGEPFVGSEMPIRLSLSTEGEGAVERYVDFVYTPMREAGGGVSGVLCHGVDVTERKRAEEALAAEKRLTDEAINTLMGIFYLLDESGRFLRWNRALEQVTGYTGEELRSLSAIDLFDDGEKLLIADKIAEVFERGQATAEAAIVSKDGTRTPFLLNGGTLLAGGTRCLVGTGADITERRRSEDALAESEARFRATFEGAGIGIAVADSQGYVVESNPALQRMLGYSGEELRRMTLADFTHREDLASEMPLAEEVMGGSRDGYKIEKRYVRKDGRVVWANLTVTAVRDSSGRLRYAIGMVEDITARRDAEERLRESEQRVRGVLDGLTALIGVLAPDGTLLEANRVALEAAGLTREEVIGKPFDESPWWSFSPAARAQLREAVGRAGRGESVRFDTQNLFAGGRVRDIDFSISPLRDRDGRVTHLLPTGIDITERVAAERALRESYNLLHAVIEGASDAIFIKDLEGRYLVANAPCASLMGKSVAEVVGHTDAELLPAELASKFVADDRRVIEAGESLTFEDHLPSGAETRVCLTTKSPFRDHRGKVVGLCAIARDITALRSMEEQLRQSQKMEAVGKLAGGVAHDFNNLLTAITGYSELTLRKLSPNDPLHAGISEIRKAGERAANLTRQLLAFSRRQVLQPKVIDLNVTVGEMEKMLKRLLGEDVALHVKRSPDLWRVRADPGQVEQVAVNLAVNARDAMPQGGDLTVETRNVELDDGYAARHLGAVPGSYVMLAVSDTGCGMTEGVKAHIFEPFFTTKEVGKGTGLGLSTVYGIVKQSGGYISVYSEPGRGTTFKVYLPAVESRAEEEERRPAQEAPHGTETVLLVEDEDLVRDIARTTLEMSGYKVLEAANGGEALMISREYGGPIHLALTDVVMPRMSGRALAEQFAKARPDMKLLFMSGYTEEAIANHGELREGAAFIEKPFAPDALARKVRAVLDAPALTA